MWPRTVSVKMALRALVGLARDTSRTDHVFTIIHARLADQVTLLAMPEGSLGREYLKFMRGSRITSDGLLAAQEAGDDPNTDVQIDDAREYVADRLRDMHDLWHVLTGYGADDTGEIANLWFSVGQFGNPGMAFIAFFGTIGGRLGPRFGWPRYCRQAYLRGRRARPLVSEPIEEMLHLPIDEARRRLGIAPTERVHPEGIRRGYRRDGKLGALHPC
jgi:ubiquinone biosynthesis protein COQ4